MISTADGMAPRKLQIGSGGNELPGWLNTDVGILDSSQFSSLHTGYFVVFTGVYDSENKARAALDTAHGSYPQSYVRQITQ